MKKWARKQKRLHKELYLAYRKEELLWYLDIFLSVNHPEWAVKKFLTAFENNEKTIRQLFTRVLICRWTVKWNMQGLTILKLLKRYVKNKPLNQLEARYQFNTE